MKISTVIISLLLISKVSFAQHINKQDYAILQTGEDSMKIHAEKIVKDDRLNERFKADSIFTRILVRTLKVHNSFYYPFDSLVTISQLYAPDSSFKIFTWEMVINENLVRQHGAIQMKTADGSLKLFPLIDKSDVTDDIADTVGNNYAWMGAVYYKIILTKYLNHNYYTLLGFDANNIRSDRKYIEVLNFVNGEPIFGGHYFSIPNDKLVAKSPARYIMEFKKEAGPRLNYDEELGMIIMEHLVSESGSNKKYTMVGDGDYQGFRWVNGRWIYVDKIFNQVTPEGAAPVPKPLSEDHGVIKDEEKPKNTGKKN